MSSLHFEEFCGENALKKTWFWTKKIKISMHFATKCIKGLCFSTFLVRSFWFFSWFFITKMYDHMLDHLHGQEWFFSQDFDVFLRENALFLWGKVVILSDFSEANVLKHCVFSLFLRDFLSGKKSSDKIDPGSVDEAFGRDFCCGNAWFWNEKVWFFSSFLHPLVYRDRDFLFFFATYFRVKKCIAT